MRCHKLAQKESKGMISFKNCHHYCQQASIQTMYHRTVAVNLMYHHSTENQDQYRKLKYASTNVNQNIQGPAKKPDDFYVNIK